MASEQDLEEIRRRVDIVDLIGHYVTLRKSGNNHKGVCPFHQEKTPSFMVSEDKQIFKCFGCNEGGDIFGFVMKIENLSFPEAVKMLAERSGVQLADYSPKQRAEDTKKNQIYEINKLTAKFFQTILLKHPAGVEAKEYLYKRGINEETVVKFGLGFAPNQKGLKQLLIQRGFTDQEINQAGAPDKFFRRIMFPIRDVLGNTIAFMGRVFPDGMPKYLNTADTMMYHKSRAIYGLDLAKAAIKREDKVVLVEGQMDVLASHQAGVEYCVASSGTALTNEHLHILSRYTQNFYFAFDADEAGKLTTEKTAQIAIAEGYAVRIITIPDGCKDAGEVIEVDPELWKEAVETAIPAMDWYFKAAEERITDNFTGEDKKKMGNFLLPIIAKIPDEIERAHYVKKLAGRLGIKEEVVLRALAKKETRSEEKPVKEVENKDEELSLEGKFIANFVYYPNVAKDFIGKISEELFQDDKIKWIATTLKEWYNKNANQTEMKTATVVDFLRREASKEVEGVINAVVAAGFRYSIDNTEPEIIENEISATLDHMRLLRREKLKDTFAMKIAQAESVGDREKVKALLKDLQKFLIIEENNG